MLQAELGGLTMEAGQFRRACSATLTKTGAPLPLRLLFAQLDFGSRQ
jgi:hypothetical protein